MIENPIYILPIIAIYTIPQYVNILHLNVHSGKLKIKFITLDPENINHFDSMDKMKLSTGIIIIYNKCLILLSKSHFDKIDLHNKQATVTRNK